MSMVERVARAILAARGFEMRSGSLPPEALWFAYPKGQALAEARAAIEAMREPTARMWELYRADTMWRDMDSEDVWHRWIDAALKETP